MKGIILAAGVGSRLFPLTVGINKQLLPLYDKPMIYYPLSTLMLSGIRDIMVIVSPDSLESFKSFLGNGGQWGIHIEYAVQERPEGIAQAFIIGEKFIGGDSCMLALGDNVFFGHGFIDRTKAAVKQDQGATVFAYWVKDPERYGVVSFDNTGRAQTIQEKPQKPLSNYAVTGLYCYDKQVVDFAHQIKPSGRGELEITDVNNLYLQKGQLQVEIVGRGIAWLDTGTHDSLIDAANFIATLEKRQGLKVACLEEIAWRMAWISEADLQAGVETMPHNSYRDYVVNLIQADGSSSLLK
jgi:glucose-1-phosphate thymidylyltransferase